MYFSVKFRSYENIERKCCLRVIPSQSDREFEWIDMVCQLWWYHSNHFCDGITSQEVLNNTNTNGEPNALQVLQTYNQNLNLYILWRSVRLRSSIA